MRWPLVAAVAAIILALPGCRHNPVYPDVGTLYVTSVPTGCEVLVDGVSTQRITPVQLGGIAAGDHEVRIRYAGCKTWAGTVAVQGGMTKRVVARLAALQPRAVSYCPTPFFSRSMAFEPAANRIYVAGHTADLHAYQFLNGAVTPLAPVPLQTWSGQKLVAARQSAGTEGKVYVALPGDSLVVVDFTGRVLKRFRQQGVDSTNYVQMRFSADGRTVYVADSLNRVVWKVDAALDSVTGRLPPSGTLPGVPRDLLYDDSRGLCYVALATPSQVIAIDAASGGIVHSAAPSGGSRLTGLVPDERWQRITCCAHTPNHPFAIDLATWTVTDGPAIDDGNDQLLAAFFAHDQTNMWVVSSFTPYYINDALQCLPGRIDLVYLPGQDFVTSYGLDLHPVAATQTVDGRHLIVLHGLYDIANSIIVYYTDTE